MSSIDSTDPDFRVCRIDVSTLIELQLEAESRGWGTRWSSVNALRGQVKDGLVILQSFSRQERGGGDRACRCVVLFEASEEGAAGGLATIDVVPESFQALPRIDRDPLVRSAFARLFVLATGGIEMLSKD